ncbi:hypothetical protein V6N12_026242 [Hibiscus sabdariffa]|uniref:Uncharacterized protein n=1 Tax=Hibiscus sabdariffa TaxID=183260 RepID=A0ABR2DR80_9ROSI
MCMNDSMGVILSSIEIVARIELSSLAVEGGGIPNVGVEDFLTDVEMAHTSGKGLSWAESVDLLNNPPSSKDEVVTLASMMLLFIDWKDLVLGCKVLIVELVCLLSRVKKIFNKMEGGVFFEIGV